MKMSSKFSEVSLIDRLHELASKSLFPSAGTGNHLLLPREYGGQGAQEDPHTATLHGGIYGSTHILNLGIGITAFCVRSWVLLSAHITPWATNLLST